MRERETTTTTTGRRVTSDERDWETCVEPDCDNRVARFVLGDFYCRRHAPTSTTTTPADEGINAARRDVREHGGSGIVTTVRWHVQRNGERTATFDVRGDAGRARHALSQEFPESTWTIELDQTFGEGERA